MAPDTAKIQQSLNASRFLQDRSVWIHGMNPGRLSFEHSWNTRIVQVSRSRPENSRQSAASDGRQTNLGVGHFRRVACRSQKGKREGGSSRQWTAHRAEKENALLSII